MLDTTNESLYPPSTMNGAAAVPGTQTAPYRAPWWLFGSGNLQTLVGGIASLAPAVAYQRSRWRTPADDDFIDLDWLAATASQRGGTLYVVFHGLEGSSRSGNVRFLMDRIAARSERGVVVHFRGCSGVLNRTPRAYHSADSDEIDWILRRMRRENPDSELFAVGYSLGGAALLKWLTEPQRQSQDVIDGAAVVSAPVDLGATASAVSHGFGRIYSWLFLRSLKKKCLALLRRFPDLSRKFTAARIRRMRTLEEFDDVVVGPLHGFGNGRNYHQKGSTRAVVQNIVVRTLILGAQNDPVVPRASMQGVHSTGAVTLDYQEQGGHTAFFRTSGGRISSWAADRVLDFFPGRGVSAPEPQQEPQWLGVRPWLSTVFEPIVASVVEALFRRPRLQRFLFGWIRYHTPALRLGSVTFVPSARLVREVLNRNDDFLLGPLNASKVLIGDFVLSLDRGPQYLQEKQLIHSVLPTNRINQLQDIVDAAVAEFLSSLPQQDELNVVRLAEHVMVRVAEHFWGLDPAGARSKVVKAREGMETMALWMRYIAVVLASGTRSSALHQLAQSCRDEFVCFVQDACQAPNPQGVLGAFVRQASDPDVAARNAAGMVFVSSLVVIKGLVNALVEVLSRASVAELAHKAARAGDREQLARFLIEGLRFNPVFPMLARYCPRDTAIRLDERRSLEIPAGSTVVLSPLAAMFDLEAVKDPRRFAPGRDLRLNPDWTDGSGRYGCPHAGDGTYLVFGRGTHWCPGDQMAMAIMTGMAMKLLAHKSKPPIAGRLRYDGLAADRLIVRYRP
ncbi:MAG TPA: cytochrome P450 [Povalibacter sp.]|nr:cytochrome P450 [Povalibacter sp.]